MISALLAAATIAQPQIAPQRKTTLPNGVALYAERMEKAQGFSLCFFVSVVGAPEQPGQRGHRHLLEHIAAKGESGRIDAALEARGLYLTADTTLDGVRFEIEGEAGQLEAAIDALQDLLRLPALTQETIDKEREVVRQEAAVRTNGARLYAALNETAFGAGAPDPMGDPDDLAKATPESLKRLHSELFVPSRFAVAVVGDIDPTVAVERLAALFGPLEGARRPEETGRVPVTPREPAFLDDTHGSGRAVPVGSLSHPETMATVAAALAIMAEVPGSQAYFAPSPIGGTVAVVHPSRAGFDDLDRLVAAEAPRLFRTARTGVRVWAETADQTEREKARLYGQMLLLENFFRVEDMLRRAGEVSQAEFTRALQRFHSSACVRVGGVR